MAWLGVQETAWMTIDFAKRMVAAEALKRSVHVPCFGLQCLGLADLEGWRLLLFSMLIVTCFCLPFPDECKVKVFV